VQNRPVTGEDAERLTYCLVVGSDMRFFCHREDGFINPLFGFGSAEEAVRALQVWRRERARLGFDRRPQH